MIEETGIVKKVDGFTARVLVMKKSACDGCVMKGSCETTEEGMEVEAVNTIQAKEGQTVRLSMTPHAYLKGSMLLYGMPLVVFIAGAILGKNIGEDYFSGINSDLVAAITGFGALILSFAGIRLWSSKAEKNVEIKPVIEEIISE